MFVLMVFGTGLAIDLARHEAARIDLQDAIDRGALAACDDNDAATAAQTMREYVDTRTFRNSLVDLRVNAQIDVSLGRNCFIEASGRYELPSLILSLMGQETMSVAAAAIARQQVPTDQEISLVLDISGSMAREATFTADGSLRRRLDVLKEAASVFVTSLLDSDEGNRISISLVPYSGQVNAGPLFDQMTGSTRIHNFPSSCVEFPDSAFSLSASSADLPNPGSLVQVPHFQAFQYERLRDQFTLPINPAGGRDAEWGWCPNDEMAMIPVSNDRQALLETIDNFHGHDGTGTQIGMKWGLALLSPSTRGLIAQAHNDSDNDYTTNFVGRPADFGAGNTQKIMVIMTDGRTRFQIRPAANEYETEEQQLSWAEPGPDNEFAEPFRFDDDGGSFIEAPGAALERRNGDEGAAVARFMSGLSFSADEALRVQHFLNLCDVARDNNILVYTVGFDIVEGSSVDQVMEDCASSESQYFRVAGEELVSIFDQIATAALQRQLSR